MTSIEIQVLVGVGVRLWKCLSIVEIECPVDVKVKLFSRKLDITIWREIWREEKLGADTMRTVFKAITE